jgi:hypothetical protein
MTARDIGGILSIVAVFAACTPRDHPQAAAAEKTGDSVYARAPHLVTITASDFAFDAPDQIPSGLTTIRLVSAGKEMHHVSLVKLNDGKTIADFMQTLKAPGPPPSWAVARGGVNPPAPGGSTEVIQNLEPGRYALICFIPSPDGVPHFAKGMVRALTVAPENGTSAPPPAADIVVTLSDYQFTSSVPFTAGTHVIRAENTAAQPHEIVLVRLAPGKSAGDIATWMEKQVGPPPGEPVGGVAGLERGTEAYIPVNLTPGDYALLCFLPDAGDGKPHFVHGMMKQFRIT